MSAAGRPEGGERPRDLPHALLGASGEGDDGDLCLGPRRLARRLVLAQGDAPAARDRARGLRADPHRPGRAGAPVEPRHRGRDAPAGHPRLAGPRGTGRCGAGRAQPGRRDRQPGGRPRAGAAGAPRLPRRHRAARRGARHRDSYARAASGVGALPARARQRGRPAPAGPAVRRDRPGRRALGQRPPDAAPGAPSPTRSPSPARPRSRGGAPTSSAPPVPHPSRRSACAARRAGASASWTPATTR